MVQLYWSTPAHNDWKLSLPIRQGLICSSYKLRSSNVPGCRVKDKAKFSNSVLSQHHGIWKLRKWILILKLTQVQMHCLFSSELLLMVWNGILWHLNSKRRMLELTTDTVIRLPAHGGRQDTFSWLSWCTSSMEVCFSIFQPGTPSSCRNALLQRAGRTLES